MYAYLRWMVWAFWIESWWGFSFENNNLAHIVSMYLSTVTCCSKWSHKRKGRSYTRTPDDRANAPLVPSVEQNQIRFLQRRGLKYWTFALGLRVKIGVYEEHCKFVKCLLVSANQSYGKVVNLSIRPWNVGSLNSWQRDRVKNLQTCHCEVTFLIEGPYLDV